jgi:hypothetical protein
VGRDVAAVRAEIDALEHELGVIEESRVRV